MLTKPHTKGRALERAVRLIQESVLRSDPTLKGVKFSVETNQILKSPGGAHHEVDVLVKTMTGSPYESCFIFECKNWEKPVGKNEVIVLSEKVRVIGATRGYLVANAITRDAKAQLSGDPRLSFVAAKQDFVSPFKSIQVLHLLHELLPIYVSLKERGVPPREDPQPQPWRDQLCRLNGQAMLFSTLVKQNVDELVAADKKENEVKYRNPGTHDGRQACELRFEPGEFFIEDKEFEHMVIEIRFFVKVTRAKLLSQFEISGQGRVFSFENTDAVAGNVIQIDLVQRMQT